MSHYMVNIQHIVVCYGGGGSQTTPTEGELLAVREDSE